MNTETTSLPDSISAAELASLANLTERRLRQLAAENKMPQPKQGRFPLPGALRDLFTYFRRDSAAAAQEKLRTLAAQRKLVEMKAEQAEAVQLNTWCLASDVLDDFRMITNKLEQFPGRLRSEAGLNDTQANLAQKLMDDIRNEIADGIERRTPKEAS
jgi:arsenate reductase-like glutaredoxin family protein